MHKKKRLLLIAAILFPVFIVGIWILPRREPNLKLIYLGATNASGSWDYQFSVTNSGTGSAMLHPAYGELQSDGGTVLSVGIRIGEPGLGPGMQKTIQVSTSKPLTNRWRLKASFAHDNFKTRLNNWIWSSGGPGARSNPYVPRALKDVPMNVITTSDWIEPGK